jgi:hypothetical protein
LSIFFALPFANSQSLNQRLDYYRNMNDSAQKTSRPKPISSGDDYINSLRGRKLKVYLFGELVEYPKIRLSINAVTD